MIYELFELNVAIVRDRLARAYCNIVGRNIVGCCWLKFEVVIFEPTTPNNVAPNNVAPNNVAISPGQTIATFNATYPNSVGRNMLRVFGSQEK